MSQSRSSPALHNRSKASGLTKIAIVGLIAGVLSACGTVIRPVADYKWRPIYGLNVPDNGKRFEIKSMTDFGRPGCQRIRIEKSSHDFVEDGAGLSIEGMQVIGFVNKLLDKCPNPDPALGWPE